MASHDLKKQLHSYIDMTDDETMLELRNESAEMYATQQKDTLDSLTPEQLTRLEESIQQADEGKVIPHEDVMKLSKQ